MHAGMEWIRHYEKYWNERLDVLERLLKADDAADKRAKERPPAANEKRGTRKEKKP